MGKNAAGLLKNMPKKNEHEIISHFKHLCCLFGIYLAHRPAQMQLGVGLITFKN